MKTLLDTYEARIETLESTSARLEKTIEKIYFSASDADQVEMSHDNKKEFYALELMLDNVNFDINQLSELCDLLWEELDDDEIESRYMTCGGGSYMY